MQFLYQYEQLENFDHFQKMLDNSKRYLSSRGYELYWVGKKGNTISLLVNDIGIEFVEDIVVQCSNDYLLPFIEYDGEYIELWQFK